MCQCPGPGFCPIYNRLMPEPHWRICAGQTTKLSPEKCEQYRQHWLAKATNQKKWEPVGDYLSRSFEWFGQVKSGSCRCKKLQDKMNRWGVAGCRTNYSLILDKLEAAAFDRNIPMPRQAFIPLLELAMLRAGNHSTARRSDLVPTGTPGTTTGCGSCGAAATTPENRPSGQ